ncbi:hypothetical protein PV328_005575 [Microctonus aethiopoides]|uniref:C2H2-type domain-containing protein n=1 Tax=Microctonus aethiopoides TaxID=144406 RepID=A0AA39FM83_9HYME|nr:hypothetical protein PV328_005575 [Microctonus aethiopoides]
MCAQLFSCPLCSRPSFQSLDSLRIGLVSVATHPLTCPVCSETLLGIDKLTIHLFGHTINNTSEQTTKLSSNDSQIENDKVTISHKYHMKDIDNANSISKVNPLDFVELNRIQPITQESLQKTSTISPVFDDNNKNNNVDGFNSKLLQLGNSTGQINNVQCQKSISQQSSTWTKDLLLNSNVENSTINNTVNSLTNNNFLPVVQSKAEIVSLKLDGKVQPRQLTLHIPELCHDTMTLTMNDKSQCQTSPLNNNENNRTLPQLENLKRLTMKEKSERCNICSFHFPDQNILMLHKQLVHMIDENAINGKAEVTLKNYPCYLCPKVFKMRGSLMVHMRVAHSGYNLGPLTNGKDVDQVCGDNGFNCPTCGKNFRKEQHVTQHLKTHEGKQWGCDVCSKMFTTKYFLKKHKRLHSGEMPYKCNICNKTFTFQQSYHKHRMYHKDDKPHTCTTCGRSFKELSTLHNHERIHTGEKPFACETCGKCFRQRVSYVVHRRIHTGVMPYCCTACGKNFRYKVSQRTHKCSAQIGEAGGTTLESSTSVISSNTKEICNTTFTNASNNSLIPMPNGGALPFELHETNKYVLIVNNDGQPLLRRESDINPEHELNNINDSSKTLSQNDILNESLQTNNSEDFFSLVMPSLNTDLSLPSTKMKELRLSSPTNEQIFVDDSRENSSLQKDIKHAIDGILHERNENISLQTINEESLKQLLYGIDKKI